MADPKGTYFGPGERGFATVLPSSPDFSRLIQQQQAMGLRSAKMAQDANAKKTAARQKQVDALYSELMKPVTTSQPYQDDLNELKSAGLQELEKMDIDNADISKMRVRASDIVQELNAYAESGKNVWDVLEGIKKDNKDLNNLFKMDELLPDAIDRNLVNDEGKRIHPSEVNLSNLTVDNLVYGDENGSGAKYINRDVAIENFLKKDVTKEALRIMEEERQKTQGVPSGFIGTETERTRTKLRPFVTYNPVTGKPEIQDVEGLVNSGFLQQILNDRNLATLVENEVSKAYSETPEEVYVSTGVGGGVQKVTLPRKEDASTQELEYMRGQAAVALLQGTEFAGSEVRKEYEMSLQNRSSGLKQWELREMQMDQGYRNWIGKVTSPNIEEVREGVSYVSKQLGTSANGKTGIQEAFGLDIDEKVKDVVTAETMIRESNMPPSVAANVPTNSFYLKVEDPYGRGKDKFIEYDPSVFETSRGGLIYAETNKLTKVPFGGDYNTTGKKTTRKTNAPVGAFNKDK